MQRLSVVTLVFLFAALFAQAQHKAAYDGSVSAGFLAGESSPGFQAQVVNGVKYKTGALGLGIGLDYYHTRSVPAFLALQKRATTKPRSAFFFLDAGHNFLWLRETDKIFVADAKGGIYAEGGVGYEEPLFRTAKIFFGVGWRMKKFTEKVNVMPYLSVWPPPETAYRNFDFTLTAVAVKAGLRF